MHIHRDFCFFQTRFDPWITKMLVMQK